MRNLIGAFFFATILFTTTAASLAADVPRAEALPVRLESLEDFRNFYDSVLGAGLYSKFSYRANQEDLKPGESGGQRRFTSHAEFMEYRRTHPESAIHSDPWSLSQYPDLGLRRRGYDISNELLDVGDEESFTEEAISRIDTEDRRRAFFSDFTLNLPKRGTTPLPKRGSNPEVARDLSLKDAQSLKWAACFKLAPLHASKCLKALDEIIHLMMPAESLTAIPVMSKVLADPLYGKGASLAAITVMDKLRDVGPLSSSAPGNLFDDLYAAFLKIGEPPKRATERAMDLLAVSSARGANVWMLYPYATAENARVLVALSTIVNGASVLDFMSSRFGHLYSLPKNVATVAHYGKPYHALMSQYLAWKTGKKYGPEAANAATVISEIGYQALATTASRENALRAVIDGGERGIAANKVRIDMAFAFAGAAYGAQMAVGNEKRVKIDVDYAVKRSFSERPSTVEWPISSSEPEGVWEKLRVYTEWVQAVDPMRMIRSVQREVGCIRLLNDENFIPYALRKK